MTRTVYVLGAGSSAIAGAPLMNEFKEAALKTAERLSSSPGDGKEKFQDALDFWTKTVPSANIEEFYLLADLAYRLEIGNPSYTKLGEPLGSVQYLIAKTLEDSMGITISKTHRHFIDVLTKIPKESRTVISLNWDIALDRAMISMHGASSIQYGYAKAKPIQSYSEKPLHANLQVIKLHGSTNWWLCDKCRTLWYDTETKSTVRYWEQISAPKCTEEACAGRLIPLMLPPTSQKFETSQFLPVLSEIWKSARNALSDCDELVFVGYSFPKTDVQFKMFVHEALSTNANLQTLVVITNPKFGSEKLVFEDHYSEIFKGSNNRDKLRFLYFNFEQWVEGQKCLLFDAPRAA